ncbi:MAG TPA: hypothetical protein VGQ36_12755 [Thermoanaerobaculia bacterium]|jgi:hypothetical protein|nr:hypothetical protein [Thermoanaerobaculia bacterium]
MDTTAIIQFIGIVLFSAQIPNDPGIHAIVPRIAHSHHPNTTVVSFVEGVEDHKAVILYRAEDRLTGSPLWKPKKLRNWEYVELNGERVQFITDGGNDASAVPILLPRTGAGSCDVYQVKPALRPQFQFPYRGAAGVIDIPAGALDACETGSSRVDTRLAIKTRNVLVITAKKPGEKAKTITLDAEAVVYVANVPPSFLTDSPDVIHASGEPHWDAYNDMLDKPCASRPEPAKPVGLSSCDTIPLLTAYKRAQNDPPTKIFPMIIDSECSNSQWP